MFILRSATVSSSVFATSTPGLPLSPIGIPASNHPAYLEPTLDHIRRPSMHCHIAELALLRYIDDNTERGLQAFDRVSGNAVAVDTISPGGTVLFASTPRITEEKPLVRISTRGSCCCRGR
eukprot:gene17369-biopygen10668